MKKYQISDSEWIIMKVIWKHQSISANEIIKALESQVDWAPKTIKTMLNRLVSKEILGYEKKGRAYLYHPLISSSETIKEENKSFIKKVYNGDFSSLLASFVEQNEFSQEEIDEFKKILESKRK
ncbi:BlaI/MecI/CopY family transcriptional regulator [Acidaminobacter sp. JC074]|uniref:BlaI/MecI/CopY family transcriptional regulator n=1 Tax=Acidaminobacter sp. JC074 TaxID=2530199 RepID=UPI001F1090C0|nr:BlaI/MecI/CopY family transcriptional regulator [Acidaminobacter sp. JC074]MCH4887071.1 BlaI/MecI/CopY family transcriptional regulator [Acidaminobacter sp. JC074]